MAVERTGQSDPARIIQLLWGTRRRSGRGPKPILTLGKIVTAAIAIADIEGTAGLSMRRVAEQLGVGTMTLYRHVPGRAELLDVMVDRVCAEAAGVRRRAGTWRPRLEQIARDNRRLFDRHPWLLEVSTLRPPLGPGVLAKYEHELDAVEGIGLSDVEMDAVVTLVVGYARAAAEASFEAAQARAGQTDDEWWTALAPHLDSVFDAARYPLAARVGVAAAEHHEGVFDPEHAFEFGLQRVLDGIGMLVERRELRIDASE